MKVQFEKIKVEVTAAESSLSLDELLNETEKLKEIQIFDASAIASPLHVQLAFLHAIKAFENKENIAESLKMEILLRAACTRQISKAIQLVGVKDPTNFIIGSMISMPKVLRALNAKKKKWRVDTQNVARIFRVRPEALEDEIIEKMVLLELG